LASLPHFDLAQARRQIVLGPQGPVRVGGIGRRDHQMLVPPRNELFVQVTIGLLERPGASHAQPLYQPVLRRAETGSTRPLACGECAAIQVMPSSRSARPICVGGKGWRSSRGNCANRRGVLGVV
jgi:hypothetical protein